MVASGWPQAQSREDRTMRTLIGFVLLIYFFWLVAQE